MPGSRPRFASIAAAKQELAPRFHEGSGYKPEENAKRFRQLAESETGDVKRFLLRLAGGEERKIKKKIAGLEEKQIFSQALIQTEMLLHAQSGDKKGFMYRLETELEERCRFFPATKMHPEQRKAYGKMLVERSIYLSEWLASQEKLPAFAVGVLSQALPAARYIGDKELAAKLTQELMAKIEKLESKGKD